MTFGLVTSLFRLFFCIIILEGTVPPNHSYPYEDLLSQFLIRRDFSLNTLLGPPGFDGVSLQLFHRALPDLADQGASIAGFGLVVKCFDDTQGILMFFSVNTSCQ